jgi:voltage-gated potassium channel
MTRVERWERRSEIPLLLLALAFLVAYAWPVLDPRINPDLEQSLQLLSWTVWGAFAIDFVIRIVLADPRWPYIRAHWYDVALIVLPMLRPLRLLRLLALARIINRSATHSLVGRVSTYVFGTALLAALLAALADYDAEQDVPDANITSFGDALWWSATTVTTVGYGDRFPVTTEGRLVAVVLMLVGIVTVGAIIAAFTSWLVSQVEANREAEEAVGPLRRTADASEPAWLSGTSQVQATSRRCSQGRDHRTHLVKRLTPSGPMTSPRMIRTTPTTISPRIRVTIPKITRTSAISHSSV